jgi:hypothetical protein
MNPNKALKVIIMVKKLASQFTFKYLPITFKKLSASGSAILVLFVVIDGSIELLSFFVLLKMCIICNFAVWHLYFFDCCPKDVYIHNLIAIFSIK